MTRSPNRMLATILGVIYLLAGLLGFTVTGLAGFFSTRGGLLAGILEVNPAHNVVHILLGAALIVAGLTSVRASRATNSVVGAVSLLLGIATLYVIGTPLNVLAINGWDNVVHFASAILLLAAGLGAEKPARTTP